MVVFINVTLSCAPRHDIIRCSQLTSREQSYTCAPNTGTKSVPVGFLKYPIRNSWKVALQVGWIFVPKLDWVGRCRAGTIMFNFATKFACTWICHTCRTAVGIFGVLKHLYDPKNKEIKWYICTPAGLTNWETLTRCREEKEMNQQYRSIIVESSTEFI